METPAEYFSRRLTDEEIIRKLRGTANYRSRQEAVKRIIELNAEVARLKAILEDRQQ